MRTHVLLAVGLLCSLALLVLAAPGGPAPTAPAASIAEMLDDFHDAAAHADEARYFGHFADNAVFLGTDPSERWSAAEFRAWAKPYFQREEAWTYHAVERHVEIAPGAQVGWFDEVVRNREYGDLRGTGVVLLIDGRWRIAQYNLCFTIPNDDAPAVLEIINPG